MQLNSAGSSIIINIITRDQNNALDFCQLSLQIIILPCDNKGCYLNYLDNSANDR